MEQMFPTIEVSSHIEDSVQNLFVVKSMSVDDSPSIHPRRLFRLFRRRKSSSLVTSSHLVHFRECTKFLSSLRSFELFSSINNNTPTHCPDILVFSMVCYILFHLLGVECLSLNDSTKRLLT